MKCASCNDKEFHAIYESHRPIENQPVIICYKCFVDKYSNHVQSVLVGNRCDKGVNEEG